MQRRVKTRRAQRERESILLGIHIPKQHHWEKKETAHSLKVVLHLVYICTICM